MTEVTRKRTLQQFFKSNSEAPDAKPLKKAPAGRTGKNRKQPFAVQNANIEINEDELDESVGQALKNA